MNSIHRARRRPRVTSVNFRVFWWVLTREAALRVVYPRTLGTTAEPAARRHCSSEDSAAVRGIALKLLALHPERRYYP